MRRNLSIALTLTGALVLLAAVSPPPARGGGPGQGGDAWLQEIDPGQAVFQGKGNCFTCHGAEADGTPLAPDLTDGEWVNFDGRPSVEEVETLVREGIATPEEHPAPMPPMGGASLSDDEIRQVAEYVLTLTEPDAGGTSQK